MRVFYGPGNFDKVKIRGSYGVGYREFHVSGTETAVSVFYPIDSKFKNEKDSSKKLYFMKYGDEQVAALIKAGAWFDDPKSRGGYPALAGTFLKHVEIDVHQKKQIAPDFEGKKLIPIIFSHGLTASRALYTAYCREFASNGYIVFALDHHDGSCHYTLDEDGIEIHLNRTPQGIKYDKDPELMAEAID